MFEKRKISQRHVEIGRGRESDFERGEKFFLLMQYVWTPRSFQFVEHTLPHTILPNFVLQTFTNLDFGKRRFVHYLCSTEQRVNERLCALYKNSAESRCRMKETTKSNLWQIALVAEVSLDLIFRCTLDTKDQSITSFLIKIHWRSTLLHINLLYCCCRWMIFLELISYVYQIYTFFYFFD